MSTNVKSSKDDNMTLIHFLRLIRWSFKLNHKMFPVLAWIQIFSGIWKQISTLVYSFVLANFIDKLVFLSENGTNQLSEFIPYVTIFISYQIISSLAELLDNYSNKIMKNFEGKLRLKELLYHKLHRIGIQELEDPETENKLYRTNDALSDILDFGKRIVYVISQAANLIVSGLIVFSVKPWALAIFLAILIPRTILYNKALKIDWKFIRDNTEKRRKASHDSSVISKVKHLHEIVISGAFDFFHKRFSGFVDYYTSGIRKNTFKLYLWKFTFVIINNAVIFFYALSFVSLFIDGSLTIGSITFYIGTLLSLSTAMSGLVGHLTGLHEKGIKIRDVIDIFEMKPKFHDGIIQLKKLITPPNIELKNVDFTYPNSNTKVLENINLTIQPGENLAIVGHNGAGKTTLVRLLSRLYYVSSGSITINGTNINDILISSWYKNISVLLQEFNTYEQLNVEDNIYVGDISKKKNLKEIINAAKKADVYDFVQKYEHGMEQVLSEKFKGGIRPSTGQWQKIAIARFLYRNCSVVVFDEPTASIDAVAEFKIFNNIFESFRSKTVITISHRFSTVRKADRIIVMDHGKIVEEGNHKTLLEKDGFYAKSFRLQSDSYFA